ncbi:gamma-glutamylcyclotransferase family protein [Streptomyces sp. NPDC050418]|uniref:gamma-glutamylcyclotransferase family protein n=1 Tax=Streptomyces sp. NPDC050418 TaxID=3365612 RepID=UPI00379D3CF3
MRLPFFVYGTLRPGEYNYRRCLEGHTAATEPAHWQGALLYDGPGYPYAIEGEGTVHGDLITPTPSSYPQLLALLDRLEDYVPGDPHNDYERVARSVRTAAGPVQAWVYVAAPAVAARLRASGRVLPGGDWLRRSPLPPGGPRTP